MRLDSISAVTLAVRDMARSVAFYQKLGLELAYGGPDAAFTSFRCGTAFINLAHDAGYERRWWGRTILRVQDVDAWYEHCLKQGLSPTSPPKDAPWGERYFHLSDPDGHELSFAELLEHR